MENQKCPLCGKEISSDKEKFCDDCLEINRKSDIFISNVYSQDKDDATKSAEEKALIQSAEDELGITQKNKRRKITWILVSITLLLSISAGGTYYWYHQSVETQQQELNCWNEALKINTTKAYLKYIQLYPEGTYLKEAQTYIVQINQEMQKRWNSISRSGNEEELKAFITQYGDSPYKQNACLLLDSLAWADVCKINTQEAYKSYIDRTAKKQLNGVYLGLAQDKYNYFSQMEFVGGDEWKTASSKIEHFFQSISTNSLNELNNLLSPMVDNFFGTKNINSNQASASFGSYLRSKNISSITYELNQEDIKIQKDSQGNYFVTIPVIKNVNFTKSSLNGRQQAEYEMSLDNQMRIKTVSEKSSN
ncbi:MAG: hypothetical protein QM654_13020 [Dysgonamonadaceae bacterium]